VEEILTEEKKEEEVEAETPTEPEPNSTIFVKNLNFDTTDLALRDHFSKIGPIFSATIATKKDMKRQGKRLFTISRKTFDADTSLFDCIGVDQLMRSQLCWQNDCLPVLTLVCSKKYQKVEHFGQCDKK
jgi:RNA recognition motif. (a.k.a. RRM, RBD, or RNP domain)